MIRTTSVTTTMILRRRFPIIPQHRWYAASANDVTDKLRERYRATTAAVRQTVDTKTTALRQRVDDARDTARELQHNPVVQTTGSMVKTYGPVFVGTYFGLYVVTLGSFVGGIQSGVLDPVQLLTQIGWIPVPDDATTAAATSIPQLVIQLLESHSWTQPAVPYVHEYPWLANVGVAWITTKFTEPIRIPIAGVLTPRVARWIGWSKQKGE